MQMTDNSSRTEARLAELSRQQQELVDNIMRGESSSDSIVDFTVRELREYDAASIARFRELQQQLANNQDELVLVSHCWEARYTAAYGVHRHSYGYCVIHDLSIGLIDGYELVFGQASDPKFKSHRYPTCYLPTRGYLHLQGADSSKPFEYFEGNMDLHPIRSIMSDYTPTQVWRWTLDQERPMEYVGDDHNIRFMSPHVPKWLTIAVGNSEVGKWFDSPSGLQILIERDLVARLVEGLRQIDVYLPDVFRELLARHHLMLRPH
jgi:hypothetical protein